MSIMHERLEGVVSVELDLEKNCVAIIDCKYSNFEYLDKQELAELIAEFQTMHDQLKD